jgi:hypothetical protein
LVTSDIGVRLAQYLSVKLISGDEDITFLGGQGMADSVFKENWKPNITITSFFGHRHLPMKVSVGEKF